MPENRQSGIGTALAHLLVAGVLPMLLLLLLTPIAAFIWWRDRRRRKATNRV